MAVSRWNSLSLLLVAASSLHSVSADTPQWIVSAMYSDDSCSTLLYAYYNVDGRCVSITGDITASTKYSVSGSSAVQTSYSTADCSGDASATTTTTLDDCSSSGSMSSKMYLATASRYMYVREYSTTDCSGDYEEVPTALISEAYSGAVSFSFDTSTRQVVATPSSSDATGYTYILKRCHTNEDYSIKVIQVVWDGSTYEEEGTDASAAFRSPVAKFLVLAVSAVFVVLGLES